MKMINSATQISNCHYRTRNAVYRGLLPYAILPLTSGIRKLELQKHVVIKHSLVRSPNYLKYNIPFAMRNHPPTGDRLNFQRIAFYWQPTCSFASWPSVDASFLLHRSRCILKEFEKDRSHLSSLAFHSYHQSARFGCLSSMNTRNLILLFPWLCFPGEGQGSKEGLRIRLIVGAL